jgi:hypothetical protein
MPTYRKNPDGVSKLTPEQYCETQTDRTERSLRQRILGQRGAWSLPRLFRRAALRILRQVRQRNELAESHGCRVGPPPPQVNFTPSKSRCADCVRRFLVDAKADCKQQS